MEIKNEKLKRLSQIINQLEEENLAMKQKIDVLLYENGALASRAHCAEDEVEGLKKDKTGLKEEIDTLKKANSVLRSVNMGLVRQKHELEKKNEELTKQLKERMNSQYGVTGYKQGQTDLWEKLKEVSDYYYFGGDDEFDIDDCEMTSMTDIIDNLNADQFLEAYGNWHKKQEQDRIDHMRDHLQRFCVGRSCHGCPLNSDEFKCGMGVGFKQLYPSDKRIIPDEDVKKYYEKVRESRLPQTWECTIEGTVNINRELLGKVCGIKIDDDK